MALQLRPNCEFCDKDLPAQSQEAMICTYECTYCRNCVAALENVCPNCGGGFVPRPIRPATVWRDGVSLKHQPASTKRVHNHKNRDELPAYIDRIKNIAPEDR
ncbi:MAG: DUF1272 domain-containing protein [Hellea sp.]|nr:DUF1272 domain-containing protein [Hellea sp.]